MSKSYENTWETYAASWKAEALPEKQRLLEQSLTQDCCYTDPLTQTQG